MNPQPVDLIPPPRGHLPALDALRGLAIVLVTLYRFLEGGGNAPSTAGVQIPLVEFGLRGVDLFFVLSGFLITGILSDARDQPRYFRNFYIRRSLRIFPLYYLTLGLIALLAPRAGSNIAAAFEPANNHQAWLWLYGTNLLQSWTGEWLLGPVNHFWSLAVEEHFYLAWPLVIWLCSRRSAIGLCGLLAIASFIARVLWLKQDGNDVAAEAFTLFRLEGLTLGGMIALIAREPGGWPWLIRKAPWLLWLSAGAIVALRMAGKRVLGLPDLPWACFFSAFLVLLVAAEQQGAGWLTACGRSNLLRFFGKYSYGMYVFQNLLIFLLADYFSAPQLAQSLGDPWLAQLAYGGVMFALTTLLAVLSWHAFEKHFMAWKAVFASSK